MKLFSVYLIYGGWTREAVKIQISLVPSKLDILRDAEKFSIPPRIYSKENPDVWSDLVKWFNSRHLQCFLRVL